jgi:uncharacterized membrane protein
LNGSAARRILRFLFRTGAPAALFLTSGTAHLTHPEIFTSIVPPQLGHAALLVAVSGVAELAGGIGLLIPATRSAAAIGLIVLLIAVWPANIYMAIQSDQFTSVAPAWVIWLRVPLQLLLIWWVFLARGHSERSAEGRIVEEPAEPSAIGERARRREL